jgi:hypothetical protein
LSAARPQLSLIFPLSTWTSLSRSCICCASISGPSRLLCDTAARAAQLFIEYYEGESEVANLLKDSLLESCVSHVIDDLLFAFTALLNMTYDSDNLFDRVFLFLMEVIASSPLQLQVTALPVFGALVIGSTVKITIHFDALLQFIENLLQSPIKHIGPTVECLSRTSICIGDMFTPHVESFTPFCLF